MKFIYLALILVNTLSVAVAAWHDNWAKASFFAIMTLCWFYLLNRDYPNKKSNGK